MGVRRSEMRYLRRIAVMLGVSLMFASELYSAQPTCTKNCLVRIDDLQTIYQRGSHVDISIQNQAKMAISVVVAVDGRDSQGWSEIMASVTEPDRPFAMLVKGTRIPPGKAKRFSYDPWTTLDARAKLLPPAERPTLLRLDVHVHTDQGLVHFVLSEPFRLADTKGPH